MREHLDEAHAAADRLVQEAQRQAEASATTGGEEIPPRGWEPRRSHPLPLPDLNALAALLDAVRSAVPPDLSRQLAEALRDLLVALRALIDWYLQRLGEPGARETVPPDQAVEDIPLD